MAKVFRGRVAASGALALWLAGCLVAPGCDGSTLRSAEQGDRAALGAELRAHQRAGTLRNHEAARLARAVAEREVQKAPPAQAVTRVREVRACASELDHVLEERMTHHDEAGAEAALALLDAGKLDPDDVRKHFIAPPAPMWRAVGARGLTGKRDHEARLAALVDGDPGVRRGAARAAAAARDPRDVDRLAEAARVDPDLLVRSEAVRALAVIGGPDVASRLRDLWTVSDDAMREDIAVAWTRPDTLAAGGREPLRLLLGREHGPGAIAAAAAVLRQKPDGELTSLAVGVVTRAIARGSRRDRLLALTVTPVSGVDEDVLEALRKVAKGDDVEVKVAALSRLLELRDAPAAEAREVTRALEDIAGQDAYGRLAVRARAALASAGDLRIQAWIERDLTAPDAGSRLAAAQALAELGRSARGAPLLADDDPSVRTRAACTLLMASRKR